MTANFVLLLQEVKYHPDSVLTRLTRDFESPSIVHGNKRDILRNYQKPPLFDPRYLVIFDDIKLFENNIPYINFSTMAIIVVSESSAQTEEVKFLCQEKDVPFRIAYNEFTKERAISFVAEKAGVAVSDSFCKTVVRYAGRNPLRILTALSVCEQLGYKVSVVEKYVDRWIYPDSRKVIECLLHVPRNASAIRFAYSYLHLHRFYPNYVKRVLLEELDVLVICFRDKLNGRLSRESLLSYLEEKRLSRSRVMFALELYSKVSFASIIALREFIRNASYIELALRL